MPSVNVYNQTGKKCGTVNLSDAIFGQEYNEPLIHQVVVAQTNNARQGTKSTLTRAEVRGGGRKPWRQKKTGRARQGSIRAPQWIKGGVVFAPKPRDFSQKVNKRVKNAALFSALSTKVSRDEFIVLDQLKLEQIKTKEVAKVLEALKLTRSVLLITDSVTNKDILRAAKNIPNVTVVPSDLVNVYDLVAHDKCLVLQAAVKNIEEAYSE